MTDCLIEGCTLFKLLKEFVSDFSADDKKKEKNIQTRSLQAHFPSVSWGKNGISGE